MPISRLFSETKSTETLSLRPKFPVLMPRLLLRDQFFLYLSGDAKKVTKVSSVTCWCPGCRGCQPPDSSPWRGGTHDRSHAHVQHRAGDVVNFDLLRCLSFSEFTNFNSYENILSFSGRCSRTWSKIAKKYYWKNQLRSEETYSHVFIGIKYTKETFSQNEVNYRLIFVTYQNIV